MENWDGLLGFEGCMTTQPCSGFMLVLWGLIIGLFLFIKVTQHTAYWS